MADLSEEQELIATYLKHCRDRAEETFWAWEELDDAWPRTFDSIYKLN